MRLWFVAVIAIIGWGIFPPVSLGEPPLRPADVGAAPGERQLLAPVNGPADVEDVWFQRREALARQDLAKVREAEASLSTLQRELDLPEIRLLALAAVSESQRLASSPTEAEARARLALRLAPSLPEAHLRLLVVKVRNDPLDVLGVLELVGNLLHATWSDPGSSRRVVRDLGVSAAWAFALSGAILLAGAAIGCIRLLLHDTRHRLPFRSTWQVKAVFASLLALPLALGWGPLWCGILVVGAIGLHLAPGRRLILLCWLLGWICLPFGTGRLAEATAWDGTLAAELHRLERAGELDHGVAGGEPAVLFASARRAKRLGHLGEARQLYERALGARPKWAHAQVNLGVIDFLEGDRHSAERRWAAAVGIDPGLAPAYFNLSRLHYEKGDILAGQEARRLAVELEPSLVERYADENRIHSQANRYLVDTWLPLEEITALATLPGIGEAVESELAGRIFGPIPHRLGAAISGLALLLVPVFWSRMGRRSLSRPCGKCGRAICGECDGSDSAGLCLQCENVFVRKVGVDSNARRRKEGEVRAHRLYSDLEGRVATVLLAGPALSGNPWVGIPLLGAGWFLFTFIAAPVWGLGADDLLPRTLRLLVLLPALVGFALVYQRQRGDR